MVSRIPPDRSCSSPTRAQVDSANREKFRRVESRKPGQNSSANLFTTLARNESHCRPSALAPIGSPAQPFESLPRPFLRESPSATSETTTRRRSFLFSSYGAVFAARNPQSMDRYLRSDVQCAHLVAPRGPRINKVAIFGARRRRRLLQSVDLLDQDKIANAIIKKLKILLRKMP